MTKLAFFDLDRTLYNGISTADFYALLADSGWGDPDIMKRDAELRTQYFSGSLTYDQIALEVITLGIRQLTDRTREEVLEREDEFLKISPKLFDYTRPLLRMLNHHGFISYIVSAATFPPVEAIGRELNMPFFASEGEMRDHTYTGKLKLFMNGEEKRTKITQVVERAQKPTFTLAFGDSTGDLPLLDATNEAFVINPHQPEMSDIAQKMGYHVVTTETITTTVEKVIAKRV